MVFDHVSDAAVTALNLQGDPGQQSVMRAMDSRDVLLTAPRVLGGAPVFLRIEGAASTGFIVDGGDLSKAGKAVEFALLKKGLIYSGERGRIAFTVPHFGRYLRANA